MICFGFCCFRVEIFFSVVRTCYVLVITSVAAAASHSIHMVGSFQSNFFSLCVCMDVCVLPILFCVGANTMDLITFKKFFLHIQ